MFDFKDNPPLSLYIHFPWCIRKCPYCDFNSHESGNKPFPESDYLDALIRDLEFELPRIWGRRIISVFIGGGTPSLLSINGMGRLMSVLRSHLNIHAGIEVTMEANPGAVEQERFSFYSDVGINRLSIGIQSFADDKLQRLGRIHNRDDARDAVIMAQQAGFKNINLDMMYGLPDQTPEQAADDLQCAIDLGPNHISWYQLTLEPNTVFYKQPPQLPVDDLIWEMQEHGQDMLTLNSYTQYEVSAYSLSGQQCTHNLNYWHFGDYLGIGAGAHGKLTDVANKDIIRYARHRIPESYMGLAGRSEVIVKQQCLDRDDVCLEFMMDALRLNEGFETTLFLERTGMPITVIEAQLQQAGDKGLIEWDSNRIHATHRGRQYLNDLLQIFMPELACAE